MRWERKYLIPVCSAWVKGEKIPAQRLTTGELVFVAENVPALGESRFTIQKGKAAIAGTSISAAGIENNLYKINIDEATGTIAGIVKKATNRKLVDQAGFNKYIYLPGDSVDKMVTARNAKVTVKENGPVLISTVLPYPAWMPPCFR